MSQIEIADAGSDLRDLVERAEAGEDVTLARDGRAVARIVAVAAEETAEISQPKSRQLGLARGQWSILDEPFNHPVTLGRLEGRFQVPDDFDRPLPDDLLDLFEGKP